MRIVKVAVAVLGAMSLLLPSGVAAAADRKAHAAYGKPQGQAKTSVNRSRPNGGGGGQGYQGANRAGGAQAGNRQQPNRGGNQQVNRANKKGGNNVVAGNTVVVNGGGAGRGYYDNGNYHGNNWDNDDDDFLEFVGKTAAVTAGVSVVAAVIGSVSQEKPSGCQTVNANGTTYQYCNGTYYQQVSNGYQVVAPPPPPQ